MMINLLKNNSLIKTFCVLGKRERESVFRYSAVGSQTEKDSSKFEGFQ